MDTNVNGNGNVAPAQRAMKAIFAVNERGGKSFWTRIGVGFENRDGSLTIKLDAIPVNGTMQVREWEQERPYRGDLGATSPDGGPPRPAIRRREDALA